MNYQTFVPHPDISSFVQCYWTLEVPADPNAEKQRIVPDGCIEMAFVLGDDIRRYTSEENFILQPRAMVIGQTLSPFYIEPTGYVKTFAIRFYPYGFASFVSVPIDNLANKETPIAGLFGEQIATKLERQIIQAPDTEARIKVIEGFLLNKLNETQTIDNIVKSTIDTLLLTSGSSPIRSILKQDPSKRRQLERNFAKQVGISPKQLGKVIRMQTALKMLLDPQTENLTRIAYESNYYDQTHFIKEFKEFTGTTPKKFLKDDALQLSSLFYSTE